MYKFKSYGKSYISSNDILLATGKNFQVFDLTSGECLYLDTEVFGKRRSDISHICVNEKVGIVVLISFDSDFAIYEINFSKKTINKKMFYRQRHRLYCCDASNVWMDNENVYAIIDQDKGEIIRRISFDGSFKDLVLEEAHFIIDLFSIENSLIVKNKDYKYFIFDKEGFNNGNPFKEYSCTQPTCQLIGDDSLKPFIRMNFIKYELEFYKMPLEKSFFSFHYKVPRKKDRYIDYRIRVLDGEPIVAERRSDKVGVKKYGLPITKQSITIKYDKVTKVIDLGIEEINQPSFNKKWVSYYSCLHNEVRVQPIK